MKCLVSLYVMCFFQVSSVSVFVCVYEVSGLSVCVYVVSGVSVFVCVCMKCLCVCMKCLVCLCMCMKRLVCLCVYVCVYEMSSVSVYEVSGVSGRFLTRVVTFTAEIPACRCFCYSACVRLIGPQPTPTSRHCPPSGSPPSSSSSGGRGGTGHSWRGDTTQHVSSTQ